MGTGSAGPGQHTHLLGRTTECVLLDDVVSAIRRGEGRSLVLRGEAGIGKTALLRYLVDSARDLAVLRAVGVESGMELAYASISFALHFSTDSHGSRRRKVRRSRPCLGSARAQSQATARTVTTAFVTARKCCGDPASSLLATARLGGAAARRSGQRLGCGNRPNLEVPACLQRLWQIERRARPELVSMDA